MTTTPYTAPPLSDAEKAVVDKMNNNEGRYRDWDKAAALNELRSHMQIAVEVELSTIPIYLGTYYTINRTVNNENPDSADAFPKTKISRFADAAGGLIMSVAVEEMLHMSLSSNILYSLGGEPQLYLKAPSSYPTPLEGHRKNSKLSSDAQNNTRNLPIPLAPFSFDQLTHFLAIEYPAAPDAEPEPGNWDTIGQIYSYIRCIISSNWIEDSDFRARNNLRQIASSEYSPNNIDTVYPTKEFNYTKPPASGKEGSAQQVAAYGSDENSHAGASQLLTIRSRQEALQAIATIDFQGEGFAHTRYDDDDNVELSHYYKFLSLQSQLNAYSADYVALAGSDKSNLATLPPPPQPLPECERVQDSDLKTVVFPAPTNPTICQFTDGRDELVKIADGLFQYMLIMTETTFRVPSDKQKIYFNRTMHQSMIWVLDKLLQSLRGIKTADGKHALCATFSNVDLGPRDQAFGTLARLVSDFLNKYGKHGTSPAAWFNNSGAGYYLNAIIQLPDVSVFWGPQPPKELPDYLKTPWTPQGKGSHPGTPEPNAGTHKSGPFAGLPEWPLNPPTDGELPEGALRHACMGLNDCKNQGRTLKNECAGMGYCSTALQYDPSSPDSPKATDHTCHVLNACRNQGGCGLYGTDEELSLPGSNDCQSQGSCATPINAERFITDGAHRGESVWKRARQVFWAKRREYDASLPEEPPTIPAGPNDAFKDGPPIEWMESTEKGMGMTACGASGMSGAGSCA